MERLPMCRICLAENVRMYIVGNRNLYELYEKLTDIPFVTEDSRPILACFICCSKLKQCCQLLRQCLAAEELYAQRMNEDYEPNPLINQDHFKFYSGFIKSPTVNISIGDVVQTENIAIKEELPAVCEVLDITEPKEEHQSDELELENLENSCLDVADIPPHHSESDLEDDVPLMELKTEVEAEQEVSKKKRRARETTTEAGVTTPRSTRGTATGKGKGKKCPTKLLFSPSTGVQAAVDVDVRTIVDAEIDFVGFSHKSSPGPARSAVDPSPTASLSSSVSNEPSIFEDVEDVEDEFAVWERSIVENPGSDQEVDLPDTTEAIDIGLIPRQRYVAEFPVDLEDLTPELLVAMQNLDARDDSALRDYVSSEDMLHFRWQNDGLGFTGEREVFTGLPGPTFETDGMTPLDVFERIWDEGIINLIVAETNRYARHLLTATAPVSENSRLKAWRDIGASDLWTFFGVLMLQSFVPNPVEKDYWYPRFPYLRIGNFNRIMPLKKFQLIKKCLHFVDNSSLRCNSRLAKISPILEHLNRKFSDLYLPEQNIALDESLLLWKGRLSFVQLIANKAARVGIKSYELCESRTGYLWKFDIYAGKGNHMELLEGHNDDERGANEPEGATSQIVYKLVRPLLNKGHTLIMDNFYNSPLLSRTLKAQKTDTIGTLRLNREFVPDSLRSLTKSNMRPGEVIFSHTEDLVIVVWRDSNLVSLISTYHKVEISGAEKYGTYKNKPKVVLDYNLSMGGVDKKDQLLQAFPVERIRNMVWYKKLFRRLLNVSIHNAFVLYCHKKKKSQREFRMLLADQIVNKYSAMPAALLPHMGVGHFPMRGTGKARCKQCAKRNVQARTVWACDTCGVRLCVTCFRSYHMS